VNSLDAGPAGASVAPTAATGTAFQYVAATNGSSLTYDTTHARGRYSARHSLTSSGDAYYEWRGNLSSWYGRLFVWLDGHPSSALRLVRATAGGRLVAAVDILASGQLRFMDRSNNSIAVTRSPIATDTSVRVEWRLNHATGTAEIRLFNSATSTTPTSTALSSSGRSIGTMADAVQLGRAGSQRFAIVFWTDQPALATAGWIGPA
jgi:hypothetical protein